LAALRFDAKQLGRVFLPARHRRLPKRMASRSLAPSLTEAAGAVRSFAQAISDSCLAGCALQPSKGRRSTSKFHGLVTHSRRVCEECARRLCERSSCRPRAWGVKGKDHKPPYSSPDPFSLSDTYHVQLSQGLGPLSLATNPARPIVGDSMSTIQVEKIEHTLSKDYGRTSCICPVAKRDLCRRGRLLLHIERRHMRVKLCVRGSYAPRSLTGQYDHERLLDLLR
jgi:hypothetical protein